MLCSFPLTLIEVMSDTEEEAVSGGLRTFYQAGVSARNTGRIVMHGFRNRQFAADGAGAFALVAFLQGMERESGFTTC